MTIIDCEKCGKKFGYKETCNVYPGGKDREDVDCPYCGYTVLSKMTSGVFYVYKIDEENEVK